MTHWSVADNDAFGLDLTAAADSVGGVTAAGNFTEDYRAFCSALCICPHPKIVAPFVPASKLTFPWLEESKAGEEKKGDAAAADPAVEDASSIKVKQMAVDIGSMRALTLALPTTETITTLRFYDAGLSAEAIQLLADVLPKTVVGNLAVDYNVIKGSSALFALFLKVEGKLSNVSLRGNAIDSVAGMAVAKALSANTSIGALNLFDNRLGNVGTSDVAKALRFNMSLKQLSLSRNNVRSLIHALIYGKISFLLSPVVSRVVCSRSRNNQIGAAGATALAKLFTRAPRSEELDNARENAVTAIASRNAAIEEFNVEMKAKKMPGLELITTQPKEMIELEEDAGFVYPGNGVLELLNLSSNPGLDGLCVLEIADALAQAAGVGESALKALAVQMTAALRDADTAAQLREKLSAAACLLET